MDVISKMAGKDYEPEIYVEDGENFKGSGDTLGIKDISLRQYERCCLEGTKEMIKGGVTTKLIKGEMIKVDIPNQREIFLNCVKMMEIILMPEMINKKYKKRLDEIKKVDEEIKRIEGEAKETITRLSKDQNKKIDWESVREKWEPQIVDCYRVKLVVLSKMLKDLNYYEERTWQG